MFCTPIQKNTAYKTTVTKTDGPWFANHTKLASKTYVWRVWPITNSMT